MASRIALSIAYIDKQPFAAARVLSAMPPADACALLEAMPTRYAAKAIGNMGAWPASTIVTGMSPTNAAALVRELDYADAAALLRLSSKEQRLAILEGLPEGLRRNLHMSLSFPEDTIGAHMNAAIVALGGAFTVEDARRQIARSADTQSDIVYVVDEDRRLIGDVTAAELLRRAPGASLVEVMSPRPVTLSARARLASAANLEAWTTRTQLPVLSRRKHLIGALPHTAMERALARAQSTDGRAQTSIVFAMTHAFAVSALELARLVLTPQQQPAPPR